MVFKNDQVLGEMKKIFSEKPVVTSHKSATCNNVRIVQGDIAASKVTQYIIIELTILHTYQKHC